MSYRVWRNYNTSRFQRTGTPRIETELHQRKSRLSWKRIEKHNQETPDERNRKEEHYRVVKKIRNTPVPNNENQQGIRRQRTAIEPEPHNEETMSCSSNDSEMYWPLTSRSI